MLRKPIEIRRILVAADFSPHSEAALRQAIIVAQAFGAEITVCRALQDVREAMAIMRREARWELVAGDINKYQQALCEDSERKLDEFLKPFQGTAVRLRHETRFGTPYLQLVHAVEENMHDLLFVGTRGATGLKRLVLGSTAQRLLRHCPAPVWIVRQERVGPLKTILAATDFSPASGKALGMAAGLAQRLGAQLHVLHVTESAAALESAQDQGFLADVSAKDVQREAREHLAEFADGICGEGLKPQLLVAKGTPSKAIGAAAKRLQADLTVLSTVGRSGLSGLLVGNTAEKVVDTAPCHVLAVKPDGFVSAVLPAVHFEESGGEATPASGAGGSR
jgi:nucleotide-binding universal stress UspA family protein